MQPGEAPLQGIVAFGKQESTASARRVNMGRQEAGASKPQKCPCCGSCTASADPDAELDTYEEAPSLWFPIVMSVYLVYISYRMYGIYYGKPQQ